MIYYTADHHFGHQNIIKYTKRYTYCQTAHEMDEILIDKWNSVVGVNDTVWHLGDVYFGPETDVLSRLNGSKILVLGNHDHKNINVLNKNFLISQKDIIIDHNNKIVLSHYPIHDWPHKFYGYVHLHGHSHGTVNGYDKMAIDVGVDNWDGYPVTLEQIRNKLDVAQ